MVVRTKRDGGCRNCFGFINECEGEGESYEEGDAARMFGRAGCLCSEENGTEIGFPFNRIDVTPTRRTQLAKRDE